MKLFPPFEYKLKLLMEEIQKRNLNCQVFHLIRTWEEQDELYSQGRTKPGAKVTNARGGESWHNYGMAADLVFRNAKGVWTWDASLPWLMMGTAAEQVGLRWGGRWKTPDLPHVEWKSAIAVQEAKKLYLAGGLDAVWDKIGGVS